MINGGGGVGYADWSGSEQRLSVSGIATGQLNTTSYMFVENLTGGSGDDLFEMLPDGQVTGTLSAGAGFNTLSYRQRSSSVTVNLASTPRVATSVSSIIDSFSILIGGSSDDTLVGSRTRSMVLSGLAGNDTLTGGLLRDILIGGLGSDQLDGGRGQDILIGGVLTYETDAIGLKSILQELQSSRSTIEIRSNLRGTTSTGVNGTYYLRNSASASDDTLVDDGAVDTLFGGDDIDWYIASLSDIIDTLRSGEETRRAVDREVRSVVAQTRRGWAGN